MKHTIALLADVHSNSTALEAVIEDSKNYQVDEYWFLGDLILPGPGSADLFALLDEINVSVFLKGNWEDCFLDAIDGDIDSENPTDVYIGKLAEYQLAKLGKENISKLREWPLHLIKEIKGLRIGLSHNLPNKNYGGALLPIQEQQQFEELFEGHAIDIAIYAHIHHQLLRYSNQEQLIINPGSIGQPFMSWPQLQTDRRAQYALLEIDDQGISQVVFRKVAYNKDKELKSAKQEALPYYSLYQDLIERGKSYTHDWEVLGRINQELGYKKEVEQFMRQITKNKR